MSNNWYGTKYPVDVVLRAQDAVIRKHAAVAFSEDEGNHISLADGDMSRYETPEQVRFDV